MDSTLGKNIEFPIKNADGSAFHNLVLHKATVDSVVMSLGDKITGDVYYVDNTLTVTMQEYIEYNGIHYVLVNPPTIVREGIVSDNSGLNGMTKYSFEFYHPMYMLDNFPFTDIAVTDDEEQYLAQNKTFSWIGTGLDFIAKLNANLRGTEWVVVSSDNQQSLAKLQCLPNDVVHTKSENNTTNGVLAFDQVFISEALKTMYDTWEVPFVIDSLHEGEYYDEHSVDYYSQGKKFVIVAGLPSNEILDENDQPFVFQFGQGVGLKNNSRTPKNNKIVTRIAPIGSENNIPYGYPQIEWTGNQTWNYTINNASGMQEITVGGETIRAMSYPIYDGILGGRRVKLIKHPFTRTTLMPSVYSDSVNKKVNPLSPNYNPNGQIIDYYDAVDNTYDDGQGGYISFPHNIVQEAPSFEAHQFGDIKPELGEQYINGAYIDDIPNLIKSDLGKMPTKYPVLYNDVPQVKECLDKFKSAGTEQWQPMQNVQAFLAWLNESYLGSGALREVSSSDKWYLQYLYDAISEGRYTFTSEQRGANPLFNMSMRGDYFIYISYHSSNYINWDIYVWNDGVSPSQGLWDDTVGDDGDYVQKVFYLQLPQLDFDLYASAAITQEMQINMRSGDCMGCTFTVQVDWELYKANFYRSDGTFDPEPHVSADDGHVRDLTKFPDSSRGAIDILVKKDSGTFGKLMPNQYQYPKANDQFVVLGISLPTSYITNAESRLDDAAEQYMLENNVYHYEYPLKFDEHFLATHTDILAQMRNNTIVRFKYAGLENVLYIKQITTKYGDKVLPQYDITLTDDVEIVLNQIGQVTDDVSRVRVQMNELQKYYGEDVVKQINEKLSRVADDVALGRITFQQGITVIGEAIFNGTIQSPNFRQGLYDGGGWKIDALGNAELESLRVRSFLEVIELLVNRMQAQEGDTMFTDNDQIDFVEKIEYNNVDYYLLTLKEKWEGYITSQQEGNIIRGIINTLAAKNAGVSEVTAEQSVEIDGQNKYFTSWMLMVNVPSGMDVTLGDNQILVVLYGDNETPAQKNFEPCELMTIVRWGCVKDPNEQGISNAEKESRRRRQNSFCISASEGRFMRLVGVNSPTLNNGNYGSTLGELPDFVKAYPSVAERLVEGGDYLYAQGIVVESFIKIDKQGLPIINYVDKGDWTTNTTYLVNEYNSNTQQYETHDVWHNGSYWRCRMHQPVNGVYYEPIENSPYWEKLLKSGEDGESAPYYFQEWFAWSDDTSTASVTTPPVISGSWQESIPAQGSYAYLWRKSIRFVWNANTRTYTQGMAQYFRMSGTDGTSIHTKGGVDYQNSSQGSGTALNLISNPADGDAYVVGLDLDGNQGWLYQWSTDSNSWIPLGRFKGENGKTYYSHFVYATNVNYSGSTIISIEGYTPTKSPNDTTHFWMGTYVDENSADPTSGSDPILLSYTWSYTKGADGADGTGIPYIRVLGTGYAIERDSGGAQTEEDVQRIRLAVYNGKTNVELTLSDIQADATTNIRRGIALFAVRKSDFAIVEKRYYDTYYDVNNGTTRRAALLAAINSHKSDCYIALSSHDAYWWSQDLSDLLVSLGGKAVDYSSYSRVPFAFVGFDGIGEGKARQEETTDDESALPATVEVYIANNEFMGNKGDDVTQITLVPNPSVVNFTLDSNYAYTPPYVLLYCGWTITKGKESQTYDGKESSQYSTLPCSMYKRIKTSTWGNWTKITSTSWTYIQYTTQNSAYEFALSTATDASNVEDSNIVTRVVVPIVKSGEKGEQGKMSRNIYFAGEISDISGSTFTATDHKAPFVDVETGTPQNPVCYMYVGANGTNITFPTTAAAYQSSDDWEIMTSDFKYLITQAVFAKFAKLGSWIFNGDYMFSQHGIKDGQDSIDYQDFEGGENDAFQPNLYMNAYTGRLVANDIVLRGVLNNMINKLAPSNYNDFGCLYGTNLYINPLKCGQYVEFDVNSQRLTLILPSYAYGMQLPIKSEVENEDTGDIEYTFYTLNELRQMVGKSIVFMPKNQGQSAPTLTSAVLFERKYQYNDLSSVTTTVGYYNITSINSLDFAHQDQSYFIHAHCMTGVYNSRECIYWEVEAIAAVLESPVIVGVTNDSTLYTIHTLELHNKLEEKVLNGNAENVVTQNNGYFYIDCPKTLKPNIETYGGELDLTKLEEGNYLDSYVWRVANYTGERDLIVTFTENI